MVMDVGTYMQEPTSNAFFYGQNISASNAQVPMFYLLRRISSRHLGQHLQNVLLDVSNIGLDLLERARRGVAVEVAVEVDLVADETDFTILLVVLGCIDPGVG